MRKRQYLKLCKEYFVLRAGLAFFIHDYYMAKKAVRRQKALRRIINKNSAAMRRLKRRVEKYDDGRRNDGR